MSYVRAVPWRKYSSSTYPWLARSIIEALKGLPPSLITDDAGGAAFSAMTETIAAPAATNTLLANKVSRFISASCSLVRRHGRICAEGTRADDRPVASRRRNRRRRRLRRHPFVDGRHHVEGARAVAAAAVPQAGYQEEAHTVAPVIGGLKPPLVVVDRFGWRNARAAPAMIDEELAAVLDEAVQVRVNCVQTGRRLVGGNDV